MKRKIFNQNPLVALTFFCLIFLLLSYSSPAQPATGRPIAVVHADKTGAPVQPYFYGMFTELLGNMYEKGLWSEMLSDRKFFYPVNSGETLVPRNSKRNFNRWRPVGADNVVMMDKKKAYIGQYSPGITLDRETPHGIQQSGIALRKGKTYSGRVILSGDAGAKVQVSLVWGTAPGDRQNISLNSLTGEYVKYPLSFTAGSDIENGRLEITGTGSGTFYIGAVSLMPADNVKGFRKDLVELLRELNSGIYRWPGGNMVAGYDWRDGIGDPDKRNPRYDYAWNTVEYNDVGTDEFLALCSLLKIDPYICVNAGLGDAFSAAQWVEYCNGSKETPMGKMRVANGHPQPYNIKLWGIGNEMYGQWQLGHMSIEHYVLKHNMFATAMRQVDPTIRLVASGATPFETSTTARHHRKPLPAKLPYEYGSPEDWSGNLLAKSADNFDYLAEHVYPVTNQAFNVDSQKFVSTNDSLIDRVRRVPNRIRAMVEAREEYLKRMPELKNKDIKYALDEWIGGGMGMERVLGAALGFHEIMRNSEIFYLGNYTAATSNVVYNQTDAAYSALGLFFKLYRQHFGTIPIKITGNAPQHEVKGVLGVDKPAVSSGSDTYPLDIIAALSDDHKFLTLAIVNPTESEQEIDISFDGVKLDNKAKLWQIIPPALRSQNEAGKAPVVTVAESQISELPKTFKAARVSIALYEFMIK